MDNQILHNHLRSIGGIGGIEQINPRPELPVINPSLPSGNAQAVEGPSFKQLLTESIDNVNGQLMEADKKIGDLVSGRSSDLHGTMLAVQQADISLRLLMEIRSKVMRAYEEVMRMQA